MWNCCKIVMSAWYQPVRRKYITHKNNGMNLCVCTEWRASCTALITKNVMGRTKATRRSVLWWQCKRNLSLYVKNEVTINVYSWTFTTAAYIIYPEHYHERLAAANMSTLSKHMDNVCRKYAQKVKDNSSKTLHHLIPKRPETKCYSRRLSSSDIYLPRTHTVKCDIDVLRNPKYLFS